MALTVTITPRVFSDVQLIATRQTWLPTFGAIYFVHLQVTLSKRLLLTLAVLHACQHLPMVAFVGQHVGQKPYISQLKITKTLITTKS